MRKLGLPFAVNTQEIHTVTFTVTKTKLPEVLILEPRVFTDERDFFLESFNQSDFQLATGLNLNFVQDNHSLSFKGVLRAMHYQVIRPQGKLVRVVSGQVFDVAIDLRKSSPNFGKWVGVELSAENKRQLWIPPGFAHGYLVTSEAAESVYKTTDYWYPENERVLLWDDPEICISWPSISSEIIISAKDQAGKRLSQSDVYQ